MKVIGLGVLSDFCDEHADCRKWIANWLRDVKQSTWTTSHDIKERYPTASFLANNVVIFNVRGREYRLVTQVTFGVGVVAIKWAGSHAAYNKRRF